MKLKLKISIFCILVLLLAGVACAESVISVPADGPGEDGALSVTVSGVSGVSGVSFLLEYNKDNLAIDSVNVGSGFTGAALTPNIDNSAGKAKFVIISTSAISAVEASELLSVKFNVIDSADTKIIITDPEWSDSVDFLTHGFDSVVDGSKPGATVTATATPASSSSSSGGTSYAPATSTPTESPAVQTPQPEMTKSPEGTLAETDVPAGEVPVVAANPDGGAAEGTGATVGPTGDLDAEMTGGATSEPTGTPSVPGFGIVAALLSVVFAAVVISGRH